jgi:hypothetical protein
VRRSLAGNDYSNISDKDKVESTGESIGSFLNDVKVFEDTSINFGH